MFSFTSRFRDKRTTQMGAFGSFGIGLFFVVAIFASVALVGCSNETPLTSSPSPDGAVVADPVFITQPIERVDPGTTFAEELVTESGGSVSEAFAQVDFPAGALTQATSITVDISDATKLIVELGPHGATFEKPVALTMDLSGSRQAGNAANCSIAWFDEDNAVWVLLPTIVVDENHIRAYLDHFSKYGGVVNG